MTQPSPSLLTHCDFRVGYGPSDDRLHTFYIPALQASVRYDRMTGFFTSNALAIAAAGIAHLITNGGTMRLLVGAQLARQDVEAIRRGHDPRDVVAPQFEAALPDPEALTDHLMRDRLGALAWMIAKGTLTIRVVLPKGPDGLPLPAPEARDYFHPKVGIFTDAQGHQVAFSGSVNESETAWAHNYEQFMVFTSWGPAKIYVTESVGRFDRLWEQREPDWFSMPIPEAARRKLLRYTPAQPPTRDPLEEEYEPGVVRNHTRDHARDHVESLVLAEDLARERVLAQFLRDAPHLVGARGLGAATCALTPWPHQRSVARELVARFPARYLLADEVGLGKTIEAGLVLRQLWLSGLVRRALILAPKSVLRQWQEELYEKFALNVPIYDGAAFRDVWGTTRTPATANPWDDVSPSDVSHRDVSHRDVSHSDVMFALASSQLVKRQDRRDALLAARPWDLVIVDEAHHARRRDFLDLDRYRPNRMLELLNKLQHHTRGLLLMTATPMQVHPIEIWDLLNTLGLSGEWGADGRYFLRFYEQLRHPPDETDWRFVFRMLRAELTVRGGTLEDGFAEEAQRLVGLVDWVKVEGLPQDQTPGRTLQDLPTQAQAVARRMVKAHTPLRRLTYRNTRDLLRRYHREGLLAETVPDRAPRPVWITMREEEHALYNRIEEYITDFYRKYEDERKGLGFVMTVYRRRLTSSFYAIRRSLEKRLAFLRGRANLGLDEDDLEQEALNQDVDELGLDEGRTIFQEEIAYVEDFVHALGPLVGQDSKVAHLLTDLRRVFRQRDTVIVFTRYTDTMDFLREQLRPVYGAKVACYSGRGGERWDGMIWAPTTKETIKNAFREGEAIKILLCTEAASEGLNLQTCGVLINYDMPWNPMRVEQRIGRIDRIGQVYDEIWIRNYFYADTVEAKVHRALDQRIDWFQDVVGPLQPILAQVGQTIKTLTMTPQAERQRALHEALRQIEARLDTQAQGFDLDEWADQAEVGPSPHRAEGITKSPPPSYRSEGIAKSPPPSYRSEGIAKSPPPDTPITLADLAAVLTTAPTLKDHFRRHENIPNAYWVQHEGKRIAVTFDPETFDTYPATLRLLTYGSPLLEDLLARIPALDEALAPDGRILRLAVQKPLPRVAYYALDADGGTPTRLERLNEVQAVLATPPTPTDPEWTEARVAAARRALEAHVKAEWDAIARAEARLAHAQTEALRAEAGRLLLDAALVELALGRQPQLLRDETYPVAFNRQAVIGLKRYGYPWGPLLKIADDHIQDPRPTDPFFMKIQNDTPRQLRGHFSALTQRAKRLVQRAAQTLPG